MNVMTMIHEYPSRACVTAFLNSDLNFGLPIKRSGQRADKASLDCRM